MARKLIMAMAVSIVSMVGAETQLIQMSVHGLDDCHTSVEGERCYDIVSEAMKEVVEGHGDWWPNLTKDLSFEQSQLHMHFLFQSSAKLSSVCPKPCFALEVEKLRTSAASAETETEDFTDPGGLSATSIKS